MLTSLFVGVVAFILIFVAHKDSDPPGLIYLHEVKTPIIIVSQSRVVRTHYDLHYHTQRGVL